MSNQLFSEEDWENLYPVLKSRVARWVFTSRNPSWSRQRDEIVEDIVQDAILKTVAYVRRAEHGIVRPIDSLENIGTVTAYHCYVDTFRRDLRVQPLTQDNEEPVEAPLAELDADPSEQAIDNVYYELVFTQAARWIVDFPEKQRTALLIDLANRMSFDAFQPTPLQEALASVGIDIRDYQKLLPSDKQERANLAAHLSLAYKRLKSLAFAQLYEPASSRPHQMDRPPKRVFTEEQSKRQPEQPETGQLLTPEKNGTAVRQQDADQVPEIAAHVTLLAEPYRSAVYLHCVEHRSYTEIATQRRLSKGTVKSHVSRGRKMIAYLIEQQQRSENQPDLIPKLQVVRAEGQIPSELDIDLLSEPYRNTMYLHCIEGYSYAKLAEQLHLPEGTVKSHVNRGKKMLSRLIKQRENKQAPDHITQLQVTQARSPVPSAPDIALLSEPYRNTMYLHCVEGHSYAEIAERLHLPEGTIKSHVNRGKKTLALRKDQQDRKTVLA